MPKNIHILAWCRKWRQKAWEVNGYTDMEQLTVFREHWKKIRRDFVIGKIIEDGDK